MLRAATIALLLANLLFFAWARGWLAPAVPAPRQGEREPARLAAQLRPEAVVLLTAPAASAAVSAARAAAALCLEAGPVNDADLPAAEAALAPLQLPAGALQREVLGAPAPWLVATARLPDAAVRRTRQDDLRRLNINTQPMDTDAAPAEMAPALLVSRHASKADADAALAELQAAHPGLRGLRVVGLPAPPQRQWLRVARADAELQARLLALPATPALGAGFRPCAPRP